MTPEINDRIWLMAVLENRAAGTPDEEIAAALDTTVEAMLARMNALSEEYRGLAHEVSTTR